MKPGFVGERFKWVTHWGADGNQEVSLYDYHTPMLVASKQPPISRICQQPDGTWDAWEGQYPFFMEQVIHCVSREEAQAAVMAIYLLKGKG